MRILPATIRLKIGLAILGLVVVLVGATVAVFKTGLDTELLSIEATETKRESWLFEHAINTEFSKLEQALQAWAKWDDMFKYVSSPYADFIDTNFTYSAISMTGADFAVIGGAETSTDF